MIDTRVERHYSVSGLLEIILNALDEEGKDCANITPSDLAAVDAFHTRGRQATIELASLAKIKPGLHVLDVGCGIGGSVRYLASEYGCQATGIDLTREYIDVATALTKRVGLENAVTLHCGSALALPFGDTSFDVVWTEHAQMNVRDKGHFYAEISRVLKSSGTFVFHDIFQGAEGAPHYPVPWAAQSSLSFLALPETIHNLLEVTGFEILHWRDVTPDAIAWFDSVIDRIGKGTTSALGLHLLMGETAQQKFLNQMKNLQENRVVVLQAVLRKA